VFDRYFNQEMARLLDSNMRFYKKLVDNDKLRDKLKSSLFDLVYLEYNKKKKEADKKDKGVT
jgi:type I restriction enzyme, R subunit